MSKEKEILKIERIKSQLEYHFEQYKEFKNNLQRASRKKDKDKAFENMCIHAKYIEDLLGDPLIYSVIDNGQQFQFEDFWRYVDSDLPDYLKKIESLLEKLIRYFYIFLHSNFNLF